MSTDPNINRILAERYRLIDLVGQGAMGRVYRGEDTTLGGVTVAVKFLSQTLLNDKMRERFEREATICALLSEKSIHIVRVRDYGVDERGIPFYVMEYLQGDSLNDVIAQSVIPIPRFFTIVRQICLGMEAAHEGIKFHGEQSSIIHRDIKPSNILVLEDASLGELVKVLDFGIAKLNQAGADQTHSFMGTLAYCSPEQMEGKELDFRSDIYSFGIMMYEMLTGDMPVMPETNSFGGWYRAHHDTPPIPFDPNLDIPEPIASIIMQCMAKNREERPQSANDIWRAMEPLVEQFGRPLPKVSSKPDTAIALTPISVTDESVAEPDEDTRIISATTPLAPESYSPDLSANRSNDVTIATIDICKKLSWPADKPQQKIVFPHVINEENRAIPSLWGMLDEEELLKRSRNSRYNQFLCIEVPHPMLLWITALYNSEFGAKWLPCYLDLKTTVGQQIARTLAQKGDYCILLFALGKPEQYHHLTKATIATRQRQQLIRWADHGQQLKGSNPSASKQRLKEAYEGLKGKILLKLEAAKTNTNLMEL
ncbi:serine/threonine protein kinase [[Leptolyngbya] sp. PCC 7376]|uniref:serine/threonine protein kinase n=1 Tax=[Leptolyngbya] sp. PCC 7376 TaxID=111781 RepID=UPI00029F0F1F|nr:serine/threonine-protein kinase [[Leptolyngbya] sp. PCC 7376]AFY40226.1 serine/threonine protein kinase [[Leptolyngbya] sp. PCC 7376]